MVNNCCALPSFHKCEEKLAAARLIGLPSFVVLQLQLQCSSDLPCKEGRLNFNSWQVALLAMHRVCFHTI
jgi:hypothetical protein